ncbi:MAG: hypothetical protein R3A80_03460 [Bdellovibrionota bacterium]
MGESHILPSKESTALLKKATLSRIQVLEAAPLWPKYEKALKVASEDPNLYRLTLYVLSELQSMDKLPLHHTEWIDFVAGSNLEDLRHRIYEGFHASILLKDKDIRLSFEAKQGFFFDTQARKSMDLRIQDPNTGEVISYKEIKRVYKHSSAIGALRSVVSKTAEIRPKVGDDVELSGIIYIGSPRLEGLDAGTSTRDRMRDLAYSATLYLMHKIENDVEHGLDSVIFVDLELEYSIKLYIHDGKVHQSEAEFPLGSLFHFLSDGIN